MYTSAGYLFVRITLLIQANVRKFVILQEHGTCDMTKAETNFSLQEATAELTFCL